MDIDRDGRPEEIRYVDPGSGVLIRSEHDLDYDGEFDAWTSYEGGEPVVRVLDTNGDDCDGLDLIAYKLMRDFGFPPDQLFRAIVRRDRDRANHMVTLWFDNRDDPWVIDSIGAVTTNVRRFSDLPGWTPTKVFNEREQYTPTQLQRLNAVAQAGSPEDGAATQD